MDVPQDDPQVVNQVINQVDHPCQIIPDLRHLWNKYIKPPRFRMETLASVIRCPIKDRWAASLDLKDAYLHVPIHPSDQRWLRFQVEGRSYKFVCLPFGLSTAPRVFTLIVRSVAAYLRRRGVNLCTYLDDWLIYGDTYQSTQHQISLVIQEVQRLGFVINGPKSNLTPTQTPEYLGAQLDLVRGRAVPSREEGTTSWHVSIY